MIRNLEKASELAELGYYILPLRSAKKTPASRHGERDATTEPDIIQRWFEGHPELNLGIATGPSQLLVIDVDPRNGGLESIEGLQEIGVVFPDTVRCNTPNGGYHLYYWRPGDLWIPSRIALLPGIDIKARTGYVLCPPSVLDDGRAYEWEEGHSPFEMDPVEVPPKILTILSDDGDFEPPPKPGETLVQREAPSHGNLPPVGPIPVGIRNNALTSLAGSLRRRGCSTEEIYHLLQSYNERRCEEPLPLEEVRKIAKSVAERYEPDDPVGEMVRIEDPPVWIPPTSADVATLSEVHDAYERLMPGVLHRMLRFTLNIYAGNHLEGPSLQGLLVGPSGCGKTMTIRGLSLCPRTQEVDKMTAASLLAGTPVGKRGGDASGGLLLASGGFTVMLAEDMANMLAMQSADRTELFAILRRIADGKLDKAIGGGGGLVFNWRGKRGFIGAATPDIHRMHQAIMALGPRFLFLHRRPPRKRIKPLPPDELAIHSHALAETVRAYFSRLDQLAFPEYPDSCCDFIMGLAELVGAVRLPVEEGAETARGEMPYRLMSQMETYFRGSLATGYSIETSLDDLREVALSTIPPLYRAPLRTLSTEGPMTQKELAEFTGISTGSVSKVCARMQRLGMVQRKNKRLHLRFELLQLLTTQCDLDSIGGLDVFAVDE